MPPTPGPRLETVVSHPVGGALGHTVGGGVEARKAALHPAVSRTAPTKKHLSRPHVNSAQVEKR